MKDNNTKGVLFYRYLGRLFYTIAAIDGNVRDEEYCKLVKLTNTIWLDYNQKLVRQVLLMFKLLRGKETNPQICFNDFIEYYKNHKFLFSKKIKKMIWETSCAIASEVNNKNKSELILLVRLGKILEIM